MRLRAPIPGPLGWLPKHASYWGCVLLFRKPLHELLSLQGDTFLRFYPVSLMYGSAMRRVGAGRPLLGRPHSPLRTVLATCHRTRLSPYLLLAIISFREFSLVKLVMTVGTEHKCFPPSCCHHALPQCLALCHIFQLPNVV